MVMIRKSCSEAIAFEAKTAVSIDSYDDNYCAKKKKKRQETTRYLPQEIIFQFLLHLPAHLLLQVMRHVCSEWSFIVHSPDFVHQHLRNATGGVLIQPEYGPGKGYYLEIRGGRIELHKFYWGLRGVARTSCNGLVAISKMGMGGGHKFIYVINPLTKQLTGLPPLSDEQGCYLGFGLAFAEPSMVYKVVLAFGYYSVVPKPQIAVLTIGVDKFWKNIDIEHLVPSEEKYYSRPLVTGVYVHWILPEFVLTLNVETEIVRRFSRPPLSPSVLGAFLPMGSNLSYVSSSTKYVRDVWEMDSVTGEWNLLFRIKKRAINARFKGMLTTHDKSATAGCWLVPREVLVFSLMSCQRIAVAHNVKTGEFQVFELECDQVHGASFQFHAHVNSLVWCE